MYSLLFFQIDDIKEKLETAPDKGYEIGLVIGTYLPFLILVIIAYMLYFNAKKKARKAQKQE
jgi:hypothetical protein